LQNR